MAIPTPRSFSQTVGSMLDTFLSRVGLQRLRPGSPLLSIMTAAAQSDVRTTKDVFDAINSSNLDSCVGSALDRIGQDEKLPRIGQNASSGYVTFSDTTFTKVETRIYQGQPAPITGASDVYVEDASDFLATGSVYFGRGVSDYEGPISYTTKADMGGYWKLTGVGTGRFHNVGTSVILAQGGTRNIASGTSVQIPQGSTTEAVSFATQAAAVIEDGETEVTGVPVIAQTPGTIGNVAADSITALVSSPFTGAAVTNPLPFTNGTDIETDDDYRERIRTARNNKSLGTVTAIKSAVQNLQAPDDLKRVTSSSYVAYQGEPRTLYLDDGTGYEETSTGIALETLMDSAGGGEQYFEIVYRPVAKASLVSGSAPFALASGQVLAIFSNDMQYEHTFSASEFINIGNATAYEVCASINADISIPFGARTADGGTKVVVFMDGEENEGLACVAPALADDANTALEFQASTVETLNLYKNDRLLNKDGQVALVSSNLLSLWTAPVTGDDLTLAVDGTAAVTYTFSDIDFVNAGTAYATVGINSLSAWAAVINAKIPGVTATVSGGVIVLTSNLGPSSRSRIQITGGDLVTKNLFDVADVTGTEKDYTFDRNTGQLRLEVPLVAGDSLTLGSSDPRAFVLSGDLTAPAALVADGNVWVSVDGSSEIIHTGVTAATNITIAAAAHTDVATIDRIRFTCPASTFANVRAGDYLVLWDAAFAAVAANYWGVFAISATNSSTYIEFDCMAGAGGAAVPTDNGLAVVRASGLIDNVIIDSASNTVDLFAADVNAAEAGVTASKFETKYLKLQTNTASDYGDIAVVTADVDGQKLLLPESDAVTNTGTGFAVVESGNMDVGTPEFINAYTDLGGATDLVTVDIYSPAPASSGSMIAGCLVNNDSAPYVRFSNNRYYRSELVENVDAGAGVYELVLRKPTPSLLLDFDGLTFNSAFSMGHEDTLAVTLNQDDVAGYYQVPMSVAVTPEDANYTAALEVSGPTGGNLSLIFGNNYDFNDYALYMPSRTVSHPAVPDQAILWRHKRIGPDGDGMRVGYFYPDAAGDAIAVAVDSTSYSSCDVKVKLQGGALKIWSTSLRPWTRVAVLRTAVAGGLYPDHSLLRFSLGYDALWGWYDNATDYAISLDCGGGAGNVGGLTVGDTFYLNNVGADPVFTSGVKTITSIDNVGPLWRVHYQGPNVGGGAIGPDAMVNSTVSFDTEETLFDMAPAVVVGDLINIGAISSLPPEIKDLTMKISQVGNQFVEAYCETPGGIASPPGVNGTIYALNDADAMTLFPLGAANDAADVEAAVNALTDTCPVTATLVDGVGATAITDSSFDVAPDGNRHADYLYQMSDGVNWVKTTTPTVAPPGNYVLGLKDAVTASLDVDWANETLRLAPITAAGIARWMQVEPITGLASIAEVRTSGSGHRLQILSDTVGTGGAVQVQGGTANTASAAVIGSAVNTGLVTQDSALVKIAINQAPGLIGGSWVSIDNTRTIPKSVFTTTTNIASLTAAGILTLTAGNFYTLNTSATRGWRVERQGQFVCYSNTGVDFADLATLVKEGDWVRIFAGTLSAANCVNARVVRVQYDLVPALQCFWIENVNAIEEKGTATCYFLTPDSVMPGDSFIINGPALGVSNIGTHVVASVGGDVGAELANTKVLYLTGTFTVAGATGALGAAYNNYKFIPSAPARLIKRIQSLTQVSATTADVKFTTSDCHNLITEAAGSVLTALDKLDFDTGLHIGKDAYAYNTGLIGEANRVLYGDQSDPSTYPGVIAATANTINIQGPQVKRISLSLSVRARATTGTTLSDIGNAVKSAVASIVNRTGVGQSIAISDIVSAASRVQGVLAVTILSPVYGVGNDQILVQPQEKPMILDLDSDISVAFV